ncbi:chitinase [Ophiocordyceps sinensis CO18]|nr:chitinase [Ophiocordyceps sinensis CO18]
MKLLLLHYAAVLASSGLVPASPRPVIDSVLPAEPRPYSRAAVLEKRDEAAVLEKRSEADGATLTLSKRGNSCGDSSFTNQGSDVSPLASDCEQLSWNIRRGGTWIISGSHRTLARYQSCRFGAEGEGWYTYVGHEDIMDLIGSSIKKFKRRDGRVGAKGSMPCEGNDGGGPVRWKIF